MKQVETIKYAGLSRNAEHYQLFSGLLAAVTEEFATTYKLTPFRTAFATSFAKENEAYLQNQAYEGTKTVEKANETCDRRFRLLERNVEVGELSDEPAEVEAAERIAFAMKPYKGAPSKPHAENIAMVKDLVEVLESDKYAADVETLGLTSVLASLKQSVVDFETAYAARAGERLARTSMDGMKTIRPVVEQDFANLAALITALYLVAAHVDSTITRSWRVVASAPPRKLFPPTRKHRIQKIRKLPKNRTNRMRNGRAGCKNCVVHGTRMTQIGRMTAEVLWSSVIFQVKK